MIVHVAVFFEREVDDALDERAVGERQRDRRFAPARAPRGRGARACEQFVSQHASDELGRRRRFRPPAPKACGPGLRSARGRLPDRRRAAWTRARRARARRSARRPVDRRDGRPRSRSRPSEGSSARGAPGAARRTGLADRRFDGESADDARSAVVCGDCFRRRGPLRRGPH